MPRQDFYGICERDGNPNIRSSLTKVGVFCLIRVGLGGKEIGKAWVKRESIVLALSGVG